MIPAGTEIRDAEGKLIVTVVEDIHPWTVNSHKLFRLPNGEHPAPGERMPYVVAEFFNDRLELHGGKPAV